MSYLTLPKVMQESSKTLYDNPRTEQLRKALQEEINLNTYSPREESEKRQALYKKDEAEKATLKKMKASVRSHV